MTWENERAEDFDRLEWATDAGLIDAVCQKVALSPVLDYGGGTGIIASELAHRGEEVCLYEPNELMYHCAQSRLESRNIECNTTIGFGNWSKKFRTIVLRNVLHHLDNLDAVFYDIGIVAKANHRLVLCEGVPPMGCLSWYKSMFEFKESRVTYTPDTMAEMLVSRGYRISDVEIVKVPRMSLENWLSHSHCVDIAGVRNKHWGAPDYVKRAYDMKGIRGDLFMTWQFAIVVGES